MNAHDTITLQGYVSCANEFFDEIGGFRVILKPADIARIIELQSAVKQAGAYRISDWDYAVEWLDIDPGYAEEGHEPVAQRTECELVNVTATHVSWSAYPKHATAGEKVETELVAISELLGKHAP